MGQITNEELKTTETNNVPYVHKVGAPSQLNMLKEFTGRLKETFFADPLCSFKDQPSSKKLLLSLEAIFPILRWGRDYNLKKLKGDVIGGLTIASLCIPQDLLEALNQLEDGLKDNIKKVSSFDKYNQEVLLGHLDWSTIHKDPSFWSENIANFEEKDFQILRVLIAILDASSDARALAVACYDLSQFIQYHSDGRITVNDLKAKERVMKLMKHENSEVTKNALLCIQRLFLGAKYASFLQA